MLDLVPLAGARRQMVHLDLEADLAREPVQLAFPQLHPRTVAAAAIRRDHQVLGLQVADAAHSIPPAADGLDGKCRGVIVDPYADPAGIGGDIIDTIGYCTAQFLDDE